MQKLPDSFPLFLTKYYFLETFEEKKICRCDVGVDEEVTGNHYELCCGGDEGVRG